MLPWEPSAGAKMNEDEKFAGRKVFALNRSMLANLVS
jgi:hypothetical protein